MRRLSKAAPVQPESPDTSSVMARDADARLTGGSAGRRAALGAARSCTVTALLAAVQDGRQLFALRGLIPASGRVCGMPTSSAIFRALILPTFGCDSKT